MLRPDVWFYFLFCRKKKIQSFKAGDYSLHKVGKRACKPITTLKGVHAYLKAHQPIVKTGNRCHHCHALHARVYAYDDWYCDFTCESMANTNENLPFQNAVNALSNVITKGLTKKYVLDVKKPIKLTKCSSADSNCGTPGTPYQSSSYQSS